MEQINPNDLPIRSKINIAEQIPSVLQALQEGDLKQMEILLRDMKSRSLYLSEEIQHAVLIFAEEVQFQYAYDPWHKVTPTITEAADQLLEEMGFSSPPSISAI